MEAVMRALTLLALAACGSSAEKIHEEGLALRSDYFESLCRLYVEPACVDAQTQDCGASLSFDTVSDCKTFLGVFSNCPTLPEALVEIEGEVDACIGQIDAFECGGAEPFCDGDGGNPSITGACAVVDQAFQEHCDTGDTGG